LPRKRDSGAATSSYRADSFWPLAP
jgi:hypothetical protein